MSRSRFACERCGSFNVRRGHPQTNRDWFGMAVGTYPLRCDNCSHRFRVNILLLSKLWFARCPRCLSFRLTSWDLKHYRLPAWKRLLLSLGAHRYRCRICRVNFVSFRPPQQHVEEEGHTANRSS